MKHVLKIFFIFLMTLEVQGKITVQTVWGTHEINNIILENLIDHDVVQRLKHIDQSGPLPYIMSAPFFSRYDHSIGVLVLLQKAKAPLQEQVAGLLHDVSHTAFSHLGDHLFFKDNQTHSYQDTIHLSFLKKFSVEKLDFLKDIQLEDLDPDLPHYKALERPLPDLCADRIQYILHTGVIFKKISSAFALDIVNNLDFTHGDWFFTSKSLAKSFAVLSLDFTKTLWGSPWNWFMYKDFGDAIQHAMDMNMLSQDDIKYGTDLKIMNILKQCKDPVIQEKLKGLQNIQHVFRCVPFGQGTWNIKPKFRGVDPFVQTKKGLQRLSSLDREFKQNFDETKRWCEKGYGIHKTMA